MAKNLIKGDREVTINEVKTGIPKSIYKDYINMHISKGASNSKDVIELNGPFKSGQQFILQYASKKDHSVTPVEELDRGGDGSISVYNESNQIVSSDSVPYKAETNDYIYYPFSINKDCEKIVLKGSTSDPRGMDIEWYDAFLFKGNTPVESSKAIPETSIVSVYKGNELIWKKEEPEPYIIGEVVVVGKTNYCKMLINKQWLDEVLPTTDSNPGQGSYSDIPAIQEMVDTVKADLYKNIPSYGMVMWGGDSAIYNGAFTSDSVWSKPLNIDLESSNYVYNKKELDNEITYENGYMVCTAKVVWFD